MSDPLVGVDYSYARPGGAAIAGQGYRYAIRYLAEDERGLTRDEVADLHAHGVAIVAVYEGRGGEPLQGYEQGIADAAYAHRKMVELGFPADRPCYFAVDFDVTGPTIAAVSSYFRGVCAGMGVERVGVYGDADIMAYLRQYRLASWFWQPMAASWSNGQAFPGRHIYQYAGGTVNGGAVDLNAAYAEDYGQWAGEDDDMGELAEVVKMLGGIEAVRAWNAKGNVGLLAAFASEQAARGELTNAVNGRTKAWDDHLTNHAGQGGIPDHTHEPGKVARK